MAIIKNKHGLSFEAFIRVTEKELHQYQPLAGSYAIIKCKGLYLICFNKWRKQWEFPAGKREKGETPMECARRELYEETGQVANDLTFTGLLKVINTRSGEIKYNPVYFSTIDKLQPFKENDEMIAIKLWNTSEQIDNFDAVDVHILDFI